MRQIYAPKFLEKFGKAKLFSKTFETFRLYLGEFGVSSPLPHRIIFTTLEFSIPGVYKKTNASRNFYPLLSGFDFRYTANTSSKQLQSQK